MGLGFEVAGVPLPPVFSCHGFSRDRAADTRGGELDWSDRQFSVLGTPDERREDSGEVALKGLTW